MSAARRRRRRTVVAVAVIAAVVFVGAIAGELAVRALLANRLSAAAPAGVAISPSGSALWGVLSGAPTVEVTVDEAVVAARAAEQGVDIEISSTGIRLETVRVTDVGDVPVIVEFVPVVEEGEWSIEILAVEIAGVAVPQGGVAGFGGAVPEFDPSDVLALPEGAGECLVVSGIDLAEGSLTVRAVLGGTGCRANR